MRLLPKFLPDKETKQSKVVMAVGLLSQNARQRL